MVFGTTSPTAATFFFVVVVVVDVSQRNSKRDEDAERWLVLSSLTRLEILNKNSEARRATGAASPAGNDPGLLARLGAGGTAHTRELNKIEILSEFLCSPFFFGLGGGRGRKRERRVGGGFPFPLVRTGTDRILGSLEGRSGHRGFAGSGRGSR